MSSAFLCAILLESWSTSSVTSDASGGLRAPLQPQQMSEWGANARCRLSPIPRRARTAALGPDCAVALVMGIPRGMAGMGWFSAHSLLGAEVGRRPFRACKIGKLAIIASVRRRDAIEQAMLTSLAPTESCSFSNDCHWSVDSCLFAFSGCYSPGYLSTRLDRNTEPFPIQSLTDRWCFYSSRRAGGESGYFPRAD